MSFDHLLVFLLHSQIPDVGLDYVPFSCQVLTVLVAGPFVLKIGNHVRADRAYMLVRG
jgi:hypothetical protein